MSQCAQCGECLDTCPQQIPIPDVLAHVVADMEDMDQHLAMARQVMIKEMT